MLHHSPSAPSYEHNERERYEYSAGHHNYDRESNQRRLRQIDSDERMARDLFHAINPKPHGQSYSQEIELGNLRVNLDHNEHEQERLAREIAALENNLEYDEDSNLSRRGRRKKKKNKAIGKTDSRVDYMRPKNYKPWFCLLAMLVCVGMMVLEIYENNWKFEPMNLNPLFGPSPDVLIKLGAKRGDLIVDKGESYRLFAPMILHGGVVHLIFNMIGLLNVGFPIEREFGFVKCGSIFILSGFFGVLCSAVFVPELVGVGASGAIFGLFGAGWADLFQNWNLYRNQAWKVFTQLFVCTTVNFALGLMPFLDNFAHLGGFICGFILGLGVLVQTRYSYSGRKKQERDYQVLLQTVSLILLPVSIGILLLVLYLKIDAHQWCSFCHYASCVPFPPWLEDDDKWWDCHPCSHTNVNLTFTDSSSSVLCPDRVWRLGNFSFEDVSLGTQEEKQDKIIKICKAVCPK